MNPTAMLAFKNLYYCYIFTINLWGKFLEKTKISSKFQLKMPCPSQIKSFQKTSSIKFMQLNLCNYYDI